RRLALVGLLLTSALLWAEDPTPLPTTPTTPAPPPEAPADGTTSLLRELDRLKSEREALVRDREKVAKLLPAKTTDAAGELACRELRLAELLDILETNPPTPRPAPSEPPPVRSLPTPSDPNTNPSMPRPGTVVAKADPFLLAQSLFTAGQYEAALAAYRRIDPESLTQEERVLVQFLSACCLRKIGKLDDAAMLYREVADVREDDFLTECALWHLSALGWRREIEKQLAEL